MVGRSSRSHSWKRVVLVSAAAGTMALVALAGSVRAATMQQPTKVPSLRPQTVLMESRSAVAVNVTSHLTAESALKAHNAQNASICSDCCKVFEDMSLPGNDLEQVSDVSSSEECCSLCSRHAECLAWTWIWLTGDEFSNVCFLKGVQPRELTQVASIGYVSGLSLQKDKEGAPLTVHSQLHGQSLYCIALIQPKGYEHGLVKMQYREGASVFSCEEYGLYSNKKMEIAPGVWTRVVNSTLECDMGGEFGTALNTGIFLAVWAKVVGDGRFLYHDWTAKVDPDSVFMPERLRAHLMNHLEENIGVYINNCKYGLHGPLEVFSRNAVKAWALGATQCVKYFTELCNGMCGWGEDMFIDQCLKRKLKVRRDNDFKLLLEDHCDPPEHWDDCTNTSAVAFHPFKTENGWRGCFMKAAQKTTEIFRKL